MKILISGSTGYVGSRLSEYLEREHEVFRGTRNNIQLKNEVRLDVTNKDEVENFNERIDAVIHLAALNNQESKKDLDYSHKVNVEGTETVFNLAKRNGAKKFIYFSTAHVYGRNLKDVVDEQTKLLPINQYGITHKLAEDLLISANKKNSIELVIMRLSNIVGKPQAVDSNDWSLVVSDFCRQAIENKSIKINSSGNQKRDFLSIEVLLLLINKILNFNFKYKTNIYNLGGNCVLSIREIAEIIQKKCNEIYNFTPKISYKHTLEKEILANYRSNKIMDNFKNFKFDKSEIIKEIEGMLSFSKNNF